MGDLVHSLHDRHDRPNPHQFQDFPFSFFLLFCQFKAHNFCQQTQEVQIWQVMDSAAYITKSANELIEIVDEQNNSLNTPMTRGEMR
jgi:hypothetical protein